MRILVVDDDVALAKGIALYLRNSNRDWEVITANSGIEAAALLEEKIPDLIVLDVMLPDVSGYELCRQIKAMGDIPIIFLSCKGEAEDRIKGLYVGGDDYMAKPFRLEELLLRINAKMRGKVLPESQDKMGYTFGEVKVQKRTLIGDRGEAALTETEYDILLLLARNEGTPLSLAAIYEVVWADPYNKDLRTVQSHVANLRRKMQQVYGTSEHIQTKRGTGYIFRR